MLKHISAALLEHCPFNNPIKLIFAENQGYKSFWLSDTVNGLDPLNPTKLFLAFVQDNLFVRFECKSDHIRANLYNNGDPVWNEETVEVFLQPPGELNLYYEIDFNPLNTLTQLKVINNAMKGSERLYKGDKSWVCRGLKTRVLVNGRLNNHGMASGWIAEMLIPLHQLSSNVYGIWRANFFRVDASSDALSYQALNPTAEVDFHRMEFFGEINLLPEMRE